MTNDDLDALSEYRATFDKALAHARAATDAAAASAPDGTGPVQAREEIARASTKAEGDYWRVRTAAFRQKQD